MYKTHLIRNKCKQVCKKQLPLYKIYRKRVKKENAHTNVEHQKDAPANKYCRKRKAKVCKAIALGQDGEEIVRGVER